MPEKSSKVQKTLYMHRFLGGLSKYIAPEGRCTVQYRVMSDNGITSGDESAQRATSDAIGTSDLVLDGTSLIRGDVLVIH